MFVIELRLSSLLHLLESFRIVVFFSKLLLITLLVAHFKIMQKVHVVSIAPIFICIDKRIDESLVDLNPSQMLIVDSNVASWFYHFCYLEYVLHLLAL